MPGKTNTETIRKLETDLAALSERLDRTRENLEQLRQNHTKTAETQAQLDKRLTVLETQFVDFRFLADLAHQRFAAACRQEISDPRKCAHGGEINHAL